LLSFCSAADGAESYRVRSAEVDGEKNEMQQDEEHLRFACSLIINLVIGIFLLAASAEGDAQGDVPPAFFGWVFVGIASASMIVGGAIAACIIAAGRFLAKRKHCTFCLATAGVECVFMPFGTVLGVFTIIVLIRESVKEMFSVNQEIAGTATNDR